MKLPFILKDPLQHPFATRRQAASKPKNRFVFERPLLRPLMSRRQAAIGTSPYVLTFSVPIVGSAPYQRLAAYQIALLDDRATI